MAWNTHLGLKTSSIPPGYSSLVSMILPFSVHGPLPCCGPGGGLAAKAGSAVRRSALSSAATRRRTTFRKVDCGVGRRVRDIVRPRFACDENTPEANKLKGRPGNRDALS